MKTSIKNNFQKLGLEFFNRSTLNVAKDLLGKIINFGNFQIVINETEAYLGSDDPASHAFRGITPRTEVMFGRAGFSYVYFIYGMYYCLNFVTEAEGKAGAVLIRGGIDLRDNKLLNGPGKLCKHLGLTKEHNKIDVVGGDDFYITDSNYKNINFMHTPRIGISKATDKLWRFHANNLDELMLKN